MAQALPGALPNLARISETLYRGGQPDEEDFDRLRELGVRTVVDLRLHHDETEEARRAGFATERIPLQAGLLGSTPPTEAQVRRFFEIVLDPERQPVFFHCAHGKDRTGTMAALYRIEVDGWTSDEAVEEMQAFGYHDYFRDLIQFVRRYRPRGLVPGEPQRPGPR
jgi:protein tyrosine/serine phosphatase